MAYSYTFDQLSDRYPSLAILVAATTFVAAIIVIFTERLAKMTTYLHRYQFLKSTIVYTKITPGSSSCSWSSTIPFYSSP